MFIYVLIFCRPPLLKHMNNMCHFNLKPSPPTPPPPPPNRQMTCHEKQGWIWKLGLEGLVSHSGSNWSWQKQLRTKLREDWARICKPLRSSGIDSQPSGPVRPGIDSQPGGPVRQPYLAYRPTRLHRLAESIPGLHKRLQIRAPLQTQAGILVFSCSDMHKHVRICANDGSSDLTKK
jgi:hypothetical protein